MTMQTAYLKEHEGIAHNTLGQLSSVQAMPWWDVPGVHSISGVSDCQFAPVEHANTGIQFDATKLGKSNSVQGIEKGNANQFSISLGNGQKTPQLQTAISMQSTLPEYQAQFELGFCQPTIYAKHPCADQSYGVISAYGPQFTGRVMLPLNLTANDGPIYVNAKQYHGIIRRRQLRAKAELENNATRVRKPYLHKSRHLHAMRRPRGCGGRFLNTKNSTTGKDEKDMKKAVEKLFSQPTESQTSEVLQSDSRTLNSRKEAHGSISNFSGSEVTSMYSRGAVRCFSRTNHLMPSVHSLADIVGRGHGIVMPTKWVAAAADSCCNLNI